MSCFKFVPFFLQPKFSSPPLPPRRMSRQFVIRKIDLKRWNRIPFGPVAESCRDCVKKIFCSIVLLLERELLVL
jgi:hypothetical protein